ncbi:hypothetical protein [Streptomyces sp. NPDC096030]|uniref:hypothetical protein n=1 Tax=Streptomyces sp. NPDC096030 TaxID=3155423 RepID=UPI003316CCA1
MRSSFLPHIRAMRGVVVRHVDPPRAIHAYARDGFARLQGEQGRLLGRRRERRQPRRR